MPAPPAAAIRLLGSREVNGVVAIDDVPSVVDQLRPLAAREEPLLVVTSTSDADTARRTLSLARAAAPGANAVVHPSALPPLARGGLVEVLASLSHGFTAGQLLVIGEALERTMVAGAVVASVARLAEPAPTMTQHLRSWWPPSRFVVLTHPAPQIAVLRGTEAPTLHLPNPGVAMYFACTGHDGSTRAAVEHLALRLTGAEPTVVEAPPDSRARWGTSRFTEFSALPQDLSLLIRTALDAARECRSCGAPVTWPTCRFCHAICDVAAPSTSSSSSSSSSSEGES